MLSCPAELLLEAAATEGGRATAEAGAGTAGSLVEGPGLLAGLGGWMSWACGLLWAGLLKGLAKASGALLTGDEMWNPPDGSAVNPEISAEHKAFFKIPTICLTNRLLTDKILSCKLSSPKNTYSTGTVFNNHYPLTKAVRSVKIICFALLKKSGDPK